MAGRAGREAPTCVGSPLTGRLQPSTCLQRSTGWEGKRGQSASLESSSSWLPPPRLPPATRLPGAGDPSILTVNSNPWVSSVQVKTNHRIGPPDWGLNCRASCVHRCFAELINNVQPWEQKYNLAVNLYIWYFISKVVCFIVSTFQQRKSPPFFTKWCNPPDLSYQQKKPLDLKYMYLRGEHWGMPLFRCWKVEIMQNTTPYPPTMLWPCLLNLVRLSCPNASSILGDTLSSPLNCDSCLEWYSFLSKSFLECFKRVLWVVVLLDQECLPQLQKKV